MIPYIDLTAHPDAAYKLAEMINGKQYNNVLVYEFHEWLDPMNFDDELVEEFSNRSYEFYDNFLAEGIVDETAAQISVVAKIAGEWFIAEDCGSNYYLGYGPHGILKLREACYKNGIIIIHTTSDFKEWVKARFGSQKARKYDINSQEEFQFAKIIRMFTLFTVEMQRRRNQYQDIKEEDIRDKMLPVINTIFKGRGNGEAKSGNGKTDILIRTKNGENEHIFELKIWKGIKSLVKTIEQLSGYLSYHNRNAGILIFCLNKDFSQILKATEKHLSANYSSITMPKGRENEFQFKLKYPSDQYKNINVYISFINLL